MLRVTHFQPFKQLVQRRHIFVVVLPYLSGAYHLHDHREVLLVLRRFVMQIEHQRQEQHRRRLIPKRVLALTALRRGVLKQVCHKALNVVVIPQIDKGVVAMALVHIDKVDHLDVVALCL